MAYDRFSEIPVKQHALCDVTEARSQFSVNRNTVLFNSDPTCLHLWRAENAQNYLSASSEMLPISSPDISPPCSVTNLPQLWKNGRNKRHNGFFLVGPKSQVLGWKTDCGAPFSSPPAFLVPATYQSRVDLNILRGQRNQKRNQGRREKYFKYLNHIMSWSPKMWITRKDCKWQTQPLPKSL